MKKWFLKQENDKPESEASRIVDVREKAEFESAHLPGAINIPLGELISIVGLKDNELMQKLRDQSVLVYCNSGYRAEIAMGEMLKVMLSRLLLCGYFFELKFIELSLFCI